MVTVSYSIFVGRTLESTLTMPKKLATLVADVSHRTIDGSEVLTD